MRTGLQGVLADTPVRAGYAQALAGVSTLTGAFARAEAGYRVAPSLGLFGFGQWTPKESTAGIGARLTF